jgi:hypothetical protein
MIAYHFTNGPQLRDGRPLPPVGEWLEHVGPLVPCERGLHASEHPFDALEFAPGTLLHKVELAGGIIPHGSPVNKVVARRRRIVATLEAAPLMDRFARAQALKVAHLWNPPAVVLQFLNGDESKRVGARDAAWATAWDAARDAAWAAARDAAWDAARAAAWAAAWAAARAAAWDAARDAAWAAARDAAWDAARAEFARNVFEDFAALAAGGER